MGASPRSDVALLFRRAGFGLTPDELDRAASAGYDQAVEELVSGLGTAPDPAGDRVVVPTFVPFTPLARSAGSPDQEAVRARNAEVVKETRELQTWWMDRMIATTTPLREKLALFWHGHFATSVLKVRDARLMYLQNELFRTLGGGSFGDLADAVARDGAMMIWLDTITDKRSHPNENFAREFMELFALGVGNYTQDDVTAAARAFTGWSYSRVAYRYVFRPGQHDYGSKTYLGQTGPWNGDDIVRIATGRPASARFVTAKLWSHFAYPVSPSDPVVTDLVSAYGPRLDVSSTMRALFLHPAFRSAATRTGLVKTPVEYLVGAARALGLDASLENAKARSGESRSGSGSGTPPGKRTLPGLAAALGQNLFDPPSVGGWGQNGYWLDTATAQLRLEAALLLASRADLGPVEAAPPGQRPTVLSGMLGVDGWGATTTAALARMVSEPVQLTALALASPEYVLA